MTTFFVLDTGFICTFYVLCSLFLTSSLGQRPHLIHVRFCIGPVNLYCNKLLFRARRGGGGGFGHRNWLKGQWRGQRRGREWRWRWRWRRWGSRFGASARGLDPRERTNVVLGNSEQLSSCYVFFLGRYWGIFLFDGRVVLRWVPGMSSFVL